MHETTKIVVLSYIDRLSLIVNMSFMKNRDVKIIESALQVFMRYGIRRTTMNDIAAEAGLVRQTLYTAYSSKNEVLRATIKYFSDKYWAAIEEEWKSSETLGEMLDIYFKHAIVSSFTVINASPGAGDMVGMQMCVNHVSDIDTLLPGDGCKGFRIPQGIDNRAFTAPETAAYIRDAPGLLADDLLEEHREFLHAGYRCRIALGIPPPLLRDAETNFSTSGIISPGDGSIETIQEYRRLVFNGTDMWGGVYFSLGER